MHALACLGAAPRPHPRYSAAQSSSPRAGRPLAASNFTCSTLHQRRWIAGLAQQLLIGQWGRRRGTGCRRTARGSGAVQGMARHPARTNHSGGSPGADAAWRDIGAEFGVRAGRRGHVRSQATPAQVACFEISHPACCRWRRAATAPLTTHSRRTPPVWCSAGSNCWKRSPTSSPPTGSWGRASRRAGAASFDAGSECVALSAAATKCYVAPPTL